MPKFMSPWWGGVFACSMAGTAMAQQAPLMHALFADHAVLQRDRPLEVWGQAAPGEEVTVTLPGATRSAVADAQGVWRLTLPAMPAGGPHTLSAQTATRQQTAVDVRVGDVWLCSGQSNIAFTVRGALNSRAEVAASANANIRQVTIANASAAEPRNHFAQLVSWKVAAPDTTADFSAACYFFARELEAKSRVPQGLIVAAWGGSKIETWISADALQAAGGYETQLSVLAEFGGDPSEAARRWGDVWQKWWQGQGAITAGKQPWLASRANAGDWQRAPDELIPWENWGVPALEKYNGIVWYRTTVKLSAAQARQAATLSLGPVDEVDLTWVNGRVIGSSAGGDRTYPVPANLLKAGDNLVVVNALDTWSVGGMYGPTEKRFLQFADGGQVPLRTWEYQIAPEKLGNPPRAPWEPTAGVSMLYNAMIAPLGRFGLRGVAWYQGESNVSLPEGQRYQSQLRALMSDWRRQFATPLPFLVVQLANFGALTAVPVESGWALTREGQRRAVDEDGNAALVITHDIGNRDDIHPANKQELGKRLARAARHVVFGEPVTPSGARPLSARRSGDGVEVTLGDIDGQLVVYHARDPAAFELCGAGAGSCKFVAARLTGGATIILDASEVPAPARVRFCWADSPLCNLYDSAGLPVGAFEIAVK